MVLKDMEYKVKYRNIKYPRLEFKTGRLELILPFGKNPVELIERHSKWINKKQKFITDCLKDAKDKEIFERDKKDFKILVNTYIKDLSNTLGVNTNKIFFRKMRTKWASCSSKRNLTINTLMKFLPEHLIEYIIYHELVHLIEKRHNDRFWELISKRFKNHQKLETSLFHYWFLLNSLERIGRHAQAGG